jgi:hypothetical protein
MLQRWGTRWTAGDGSVFPSEREGRRYEELLLRRRAGDIRNLRRQVKYPLDVNGVRITTWTADFVYEEGPTWETAVEDVKGWPNDRWPMKRALMLAVHGIRVREIRMLRRKAGWVGMVVERSTARRR